MKYMRANELAQWLGVSTKTIYNWYCKGYFGKFLIGGVALYRISDVINAFTELKAYQSKSGKNNK